MPTIRSPHLVHSMLNYYILVRLILGHSTLISKRIAMSTYSCKQKRS